jgi:hypothetical protein
MYVSLYPPVLSSRCPRPPPSLTCGEEHGGLSRLECLDSASDPGWQGLIPTGTSPSLFLRFPFLSLLPPVPRAFRPSTRAPRWKTSVQ